MRLINIKLSINNCMADHVEKLNVRYILNSVLLFPYCFLFHFPPRRKISMILNYILYFTLAKCVDVGEQCQMYRS